MKNLILILVLSIALFSCGDSGNNPTNSSVLMPLIEKNTWEYVNYTYDSSTTDTITYSITVDSEIVYKSENYFKLKFVNHTNNDTYIVRTYYKNKSDGLYFFDDATDEIIKFQYPTYKGQVFFKDESNKSYVDDMDYEVITPIGKFKCIKYVNIKYNHGIEIERCYSYYTPDIGNIAVEHYITDSKNGNSKLVSKTLLTNFTLNGGITIK